jgi:peptidoglycan-N-acetylglucosamine deacetylase
VKAWLRDLAKEALQSVVLPGRFVWRLPARAADGIALTFDDGPDPQSTPAILDLLSAHQVRATFFVIGKQVEAHPETARRIVDAGHAIAGHTYSHRELPSLDPATMSTELERCRRVIADATGVDTRLVRPPRGRLDWRSLRLAAKLGYTVVHWSRTYSDYRRDGVDALLSRMRAAPPIPRDVILLHDVVADTIGALAVQLPAMSGSGLVYRRLTPDLFAA